MDESHATSPVEMDVVVGPNAEGAREGDRSRRPHGYVSRDGT